MKFIFLTIAVMAATSAWAHGDAEWIMNNPVTAWCCGLEDCGALADGDVEITRSGYYIRSRQEVIPFGSKRIQTSKDEHYWLCVTLLSDKPWPEGLARCFFVPNVGS